MSIPNREVRRKTKEIKLRNSIIQQDDGEVSKDDEEGESDLVD